MDVKYSYVGIYGLTCDAKGYGSKCEDKCDACSRVSKGSSYKVPAPTYITSLYCIAVMTHM
jgi:hypothetical protein